MSRKIRIPIRSLGAEVRDPKTSDLASWIATHHGREADLITYKLEESLQGQGSIDIPAAGGRFYLPRLVASIGGIEDGILRGEPELDLRHVASDVETIRVLQPKAWCAIPAPHLWGITDQYYHDPEEFTIALCECVIQLTRSMRDQGVKGHILLCDQYFQEEIDVLTGPKTKFYTDTPTHEDLALILEHQRTLAVPAEKVKIALGLLDEFEIRRLTVVDPTRETLDEVLTRFDPDSIEAGGYCKNTCEEYWSQIIDSAYILR